MRRSTAILIFLASIAASLLAGVLYLASSRPAYVAAAIVYPAADTDARPPGTLGGLALLDSVTSPPTPFQKFLAILHTPRFVEAIDQRLHLAQKMFPDEWDAASNRWRPQPGLFSWAERTAGGTTPEFDPLRALIRVFRQDLRITETDKRNSITEISFTSPDRQISDETLKAGLETAQTLLIEQETALLTQEIAYLENQLETVQLAEHRTELARLLTERERQMMLLKAGAYGAQILQPVYTPPQPERPSIRLTLLLAACAGAALGIAIVSLTTLRSRPASG
jgi:uncharacterized protein involved in exopolysaccharide biosynthesis